VEALATAGAFGSLDSSGPAAGQKLSRREALWAAGAVTQAGPDRLEGVVCGADAPTLPGMSEVEVAAADLWATGVAPDHHPVQFARAHLDRLGAVTVAGLDDVPHGRRVLVGGIVTHRQRPATAQGTIFFNLEDETGMLNVICSAGVWARHRRVARAAPALLVRGRLERAGIPSGHGAAIPFGHGAAIPFGHGAGGVTNLVAQGIEALSLSVAAARSRDFR
jgi:error-prone DNA polymerase